MLGILAQASDGTAGGASQLAAFLPLLLMGVIFYFLLIRPQNQRRRAQMQMQSELAVGDEVVTTAGIYGTVTEIDDDYGIVTLEVAPGTEMRFSRAAAAQRHLPAEVLLEAAVVVPEPGSCATRSPLETRRSPRPRSARRTNRLRACPWSRCRSAPRRPRRGPRRRPASPWKTSRGTRSSPCTSPPPIA